MAKITWVGPISTGRSHLTYFGSIAGERDVMTIVAGKNPAGGKPTWHLTFNDGSLREPRLPTHYALDDAKASAEDDLRQPISAHGKIARVERALFDTKCKFPGHGTMSDDDIYAACEFVAARYRDIRAAEIYARFGRHRAAA